MKKIVFLKVLAFILILSSCKNTQLSHTMILPVFDKEGHRGCRGLMPENTVEAMLKAIDLGVTTLEMDIVFTKDEKAVLSHEPFYNHEITTLPDGGFIKEADEKKYNIYQMLYAETNLLDVGKKPHPRFPKQNRLPAIKPLLSDLIDAVEQKIKIDHLKPVFYNIETKTKQLTDGIFHPAPELFVALLMEVINSRHIADRVIIQSFDFRTLQLLHKKFPRVKTAMLIEDYDKRTLEDQLKSLGFIPTIYSPDQSLVNDQLIEKCHRQNIKVIPWTVNEQSKMEALKKMGVDGIITDYPNLFAEMK